MSKRIARLLEESEEKVAKLLQELERVNGLPSHDVRHIAYTHQAIRKKLIDLSLDPDDTTAQELYHALLVRFDDDSRRFDESYGVVSAIFDDKVALAAKLLHHSDRMPRAWALKSSAAKDLLRRMPPKRTMKALNYRSVESLIKRDNLAEVMVAAEVLESGAWHAQFQRAVSKLDQTDLELREIKLVVMPSSKWQNIVDENGVMVCIEEAVMTIWPNPDSHNESLLSIMLAFLEELENFGSHLSLKELFENDDVIGWWADMDHLVADLKEGNVSLNIRDVRESWTALSGYDARQTLRGRREYWQELINKYEKKHGLQEIFDGSAMQKIRRLKINAPQPAYEFEYSEEDI